MFDDVMRENAYLAYRGRLDLLLRIPTEASDQDIHELIEAGFSVDRIENVCDAGWLSLLDCDKIVPLNTLKSRLACGQRLTVDESDRLFRVVHIIAMAGALFEDDEKAKRWLSKSKERFFGKSPIAMLSTMQGTWRVEELLIQLADGISF